MSNQIERRTIRNATAIEMYLSRKAEIFRVTIQMWEARVAAHEAANGDYYDEKYQSARRLLRMFRIAEQAHTALCHSKWTPGVRMHNLAKGIVSVPL